MKEYKTGDIINDVRPWSRHSNGFDLGIVVKVYGKDTIIELVNDLMNSSLDNEKTGALLRRVLRYNICHMKVVVGDKQCIVRSWAKNSLRLLSWIK